MKSQEAFAESAKSSRRPSTRGSSLQRDSISKKGLKGLIGLSPARSSGLSFSNGESVSSCFAVLSLTLGSEVCREKISCSYSTTWELFI